MATRRERVVLELEDLYTAPIIKAVAATQLLDKSLDHLSGQAVETSKTTRQIDKDVDSLGKTARRTDKDIDKLSGRLRILADVAAILAPAIAPIGAVGVAAFSGLASQLGFAAIGAGTFVLAFQGVGDALKALNKYELEPTEANLMAARLELERLSPAAQDFTKHLAALKPQMKELRDLAASGLFPGLTEGLDGLEDAWPRVEKIITAISTELGDITGDAGQSLGSDRWAPFLDFLAEEAPSALADFATATGNTVHALAGLWMATDPLNDDFSAWLVEATADLDRWAAGVDQTQGFADFLAYVEETGPQVGETLGALANAVLQIVEAAAPLGGPVLQGLEATADVISAIADSDIGTPIFAGIAALSLFNRTVAVTGTLTKTTLGGMVVGQAKASAGVRTLITDFRILNAETKFTPGRGFAGDLTKADQALGRLKRTAAGVGKSAAVVGGLAVASTGAADKIGLTNTASLALMGTIAGPWGAAIGGGIGLALDFAHANDDVEDALKRVDVIASSGNLAYMREELQRLADAGDDHAVKALKVKIAYEETAQAMEQSGAAALLLQDGLQGTAAGLITATQTANEFTESLTRAHDALNQRSAARDYEAAIDDFSAALKENGKNLDINTEKGRENQAALDRISSSALGLAEEIQNPILRAKFLDNARQEFINAAVKAGMARKEARRLATQVGLLNQVKGRPKIDTGSLDDAIRKGNLLLGIFAALNVKSPPGMVPIEDSGDAAGLIPGSADGSTVPKTGRPYADRHLYLLADGEEVVSNRRGQADRYRPLLKAINNAADGASVGRTGGGLYDYIRNDLDMKFPNTLKEWNRALAASTRTIEKDTAARDDLISKRDSLRETVSGSFRSDLFGEKPTNWAFMSEADRGKYLTQHPTDVANQDTANANQFEGLLKALAGKGLDGGAYDALAATGDIQRAQAFASQSSAQIAQYETAYNRRDRALTSVGTVAGNAAWGAQLAEANQELREANRHHKTLEQRVDNLAKAVRNAGRDVRDGVNGANSHRAGQLRVS